MTRHPRFWIIAVLLVACAGGILPGAVSFGQAPAAVTVPNGTIAEGTDYFTQVWQDPVDMNEFTDISQYLNESGQRADLRDIGVANGVFSANAGTDPNFAPLFAGYRKPGGTDARPLAVRVGKVGMLRPIDSARYRCLNFAMKATTGGFQAGNPVQLLAFWWRDELQNAAGGTWGVTSLPIADGLDIGLAVTPSVWRTYNIDLSRAGAGFGNAAWNASPTWSGLRIDPVQESYAPGASFAVDWVRMTDCAPNNVDIRWNSRGNSLFVRPQGTDRVIFIKRVSGNGAQIDTNQLAPGSYDVCVGNIDGNGGYEGDPCATVSGAPLVVNQRPTGVFATPNFNNGQDYAANAGNPWDFSDPVDGVVRGAAGSYGNGGLTVVTDSGPLPAGADAQVVLNTPIPLDPNEYRYLTFKMDTRWNANWQNVPDGMIVRWIWSVQGASGRAGFRCNLVGYDVPYDIGNQTYTIDLHDPFNGSVEEWQGDCPANVASLTWRTAGPVLGMRFDPNENVTIANQAGKPVPGGPFTQVIDDIKLTKDIVVRSGQTYNVVLGTNKSGVQATYYYTNDRNNPTQNRAAPASDQPPGNGNGARKIFAPLVINGFASNVDAVPNAQTFRWTTAGVGAGTYYVCATLTDGVQENTVCSDAPVIVR